MLEPQVNVRDVDWLVAPFAGLVLLKAAGGLTAVVNDQKAVLEPFE